MIFSLVQRAILILLAVMAVWGLGLFLGGGMALAVWAAVGAIACCAGTLLLWTSATDKVTWKNRLAGCLIPWGGRLNGGRLWPIPVISWLVWMAIAAATVWLMLASPAEPEVGQGDGVKTADRIAHILLLVAWIVDGSTIVYVLGTLSQAGAGSSSHRNTLLKTVAIIFAIIVGSVILHGVGATRLALTVAGTPPLIVGGGFGLFLAAVLVFGRKVRWN